MVNLIKILSVNIYLNYKFCRLLFQHFPNKKIWRRAFYNYLLDARYVNQTKKKQPPTNKIGLLYVFTRKRLKLKKKATQKANVKKDFEMPVLVCVLNNEMEKLPLFFSHYREMGIKRFVMIDNMSSDGTYEFLLKQKDVELYSVKETFRGYLKEGWINQILALYGYDRWYLVVDADELLVWPQMERVSLKNLIRICQAKKEYRPMAIMLDMYSRGKLFCNQTSNIYSEFSYCDLDTYYWIKNQEVDILSGGPRERVFGSKVWLSKTPLFYLKPMDIFCCAHYMYPYKKDRKRCCPIALLHYKFAYESSYSMMKEYVKKGVDENRIEESKIYFGKKRAVLFYEGSLHLDKSEKLSKIKCLTNIAEQELGADETNAW